MPKIDIASLPVHTGTAYPKEFHHVVKGRERQRLGDAVGLTQFGVNLTRLRPGAASALRHWHEAEDELVYVLRAFDAAGNRSLRSNVASAGTSVLPDPAQLGQWTAPFDLGVVGVHAIVLHTGEVLVWRGKTPSVGTIAKLWDPATGSVTEVPYRTSSTTRPAARNREAPLRVGKKASVAAIASRKGAPSRIVWRIHQSLPS
jgi:hypothetical protein